MTATKAITDAITNTNVVAVYGTKNPCSELSTSVDGSGTEGAVRFAGDIVVLEFAVSPEAHCIWE